ncbi:MAG: glycosyltransferase family 4 protein [Candidatus Cloacimonetes bacterium]|nr:glycosyltransferase family 4 protein [Candidatus Cloacimonadota bacterium]
MKNVLFISYFFPPLGGPGVQRSVKFCKYLPEFGWHPIILTVKDIAYIARDDSLTTEVKNVDLDRTDSLDMMRLLYLFEKLKDTNQEQGIYTKTSQHRKQFFRDIFPIDSKIGWIPFAYREGKKICKTQNIDVIYSTVGPFSSAILGYRLSKKFGIPFVVDYRDLFVGKPDESYLTSWHERYAYKWEKKILSRASAVIMNTERAKKRICELYPLINDTKFSVLYNGFDAEDYSQNFATSKNKIIFTYTGGFYGERSPAFLIKALEELKESRILPENVLFRFFGNISDSIREEFEHSKIKDHIQLTSQVSHKDSIKELLESDFLLLFIAKYKGELVIPAKLFEYLAARKPILAIIPSQGEAAHIINRNNAGIVCESDDIEKIKEAVVELVRERELGIITSRFPLAANDYSVFERRTLTGKLAETLNMLL